MIFIVKVSYCLPLIIPYAFTNEFYNYLWGNLITGNSIIQDISSFIHYILYICFVLCPVVLSKLWALCSKIFSGNFLELHWVPVIEPMSVTHKARDWPAVLYLQSPSFTRTKCFSIKNRKIKKDESNIVIHSESRTSMDVLHFMCKAIS